MAKVVNLRSARKSRKRAEERRDGAENAARFGQSKALKSLEKARKDKAEAGLDGHRREGDGE